ncbi:non-specific lipid transfer protein GPI-anchored 2 isoform X2 [Neltuma alba]|uniref:non-specific lipid transfer protein GPI-anchored 2 isoform X2 n=1 Tax=Neltuma alba TaxID=207710 RepID=UPI0010A32EC5|nr:non-specific lipid transfer protein GPI-anchored 2-like isoform X2 [Prosopis alba]
MATTGRRMAASAATVLVLCILACGVGAQSPVAAPGPAGGNDCFTALTNMSDCLTYVEEGSKQKKPEKACCGELAGLVDSNPICLCQLLAKPDFAGVKLDLNKALRLPSVCGVSTPPVSTCSAVGVPVSALPPSSSNANPSLSPMGAVAGPGPAAGGGGCMTALMNMSDCLTFVEEGSKQKKPQKACCGELAGLVDSNPICLCQLLAKPDFAGIKLNLNKALRLPSLCGVSTPPVSTCSAVGVPVSLAPSSTPSPTPGGTLAPTSPSNLASPALSPGGSLTSPPGNGAISLSNPSSGLPFIFGMATLFLPIFL